MTEHYSPITDPFLYYQFFSKVIEKVIYIQINDFIVEHKLFFNHQYGFRSGHSTELAALDLADRIITARRTSHLWYPVSEVQHITY